MEDDSSNLNIEWKKNKGFGETEKLTRKTNVKKALQHEATEKKPLVDGFAPVPAELPKGLKKIRKKIKDVYDDEDEDEYYDALPVDPNSSLLNALYEDERRMLKQKETLNTQQMQQSAGRLEAVAVANKLSNQIGFKGLSKKAAANAADVTLINNPLEKILQDDLSQRTKTNVRKLSKGETIVMLRGIERIRKMAMAADESQLKALEKMKIEDIISAGEKSTDDQKVAELILKKSGRKNKKEEAAKVVKKSREQSKNQGKPKKSRSDSKVLNNRNLSMKDIFRD